MRRAPVRSALARAGLLLSLALAWAGCAPPPPGSLESLEARSRSDAEKRDRRARSCEARMVFRLESRGTGRLPAVEVTTRLASPDRVRMRARWLLGTLLDVALTGDTLTAWMPGERLGLLLPGLGDTLGVPDPAGVVRRALAANWPAPREAWRRAHADSAGAALDWSEQGRDWTLRVDRSGRPREVTWSRDGRAITLRYSDWHGAGSSAWPERIEMTDGAGRLKLRLTVEDVRPIKHTPPSWFALELPEDVQPFGFEDLRRVLSGRGAAR